MKILVGSKVFFNNYDDFKSHDTDYILFENHPNLYKTFAVLRGKNTDIFAYNEISKKAFLEFSHKHCKTSTLAIGTLIVPELLNYMKITFDEFKEFKYAADKVNDGKHNYVKLIYYSYLENGGFYLTQEQRDKAYEEYKKYRIVK